ncbi:MAG: ArgE/DapE family deacylase [Candidatus Nanopelagicales bacterium]|nr:ArgE/DapE family deacylase [Candidatus Nanopelagicales bacterium]
MEYSPAATGPIINYSALSADLSELLGIASMGGQVAEWEIQRHLATRWRAEGLEVREWDLDLERLQLDPAFPGMEVARTAAVGVTATWVGTGGGATLLINAHTDVVPPGDLAAWTGDPFTPRSSTRAGRDVLIARGACDMKAGLVAAWAALRAVRASGVRLRGDVILAPVSGEEDGGLGTFALIREFQRCNQHIDMCVIPEPTGLDLIPANGGALTFRLIVRGAAVHASRRTEGVSAIEKLIPLMSALSAFERDRNLEVDPLMQRWPIAYPLSIGTVHAGDWASTVPDLLIAEGRYGVALGESADAARLKFEGIVAAACALDPWLRDHPVEVQWWGGQFESGSTKIDARIITELSAAHLAVTGRTPEVYGGPYGSDLRLLSGLAGIQTVQYGPGDAGIAHSPDEYVFIDEVNTCAEVLAQLILQVCA